LSPIRYVHDVYSVDEKGELIRHVDTIETKAAFRRAMIDHHASGDAERLAFRLRGDPEWAVWLVYPYVNRCGDLSVAFFPRFDIDDDGHANHREETPRLAVGAADIF